MISLECGTVMGQWFGFGQDATVIVSKNTESPLGHANEAQSTLGRKALSHSNATAMCVTCGVHAHSEHAD